MINVFIVAPRFCWHTSDLLKLQNYNAFTYFLVYDTPPFISRAFYNKFFTLISSIISYESLQRIWRLITLVPWVFYLSFTLRRHSYPIHCHGLFAFVITRFTLIPTSRIVFTPQGSDLLVLPYKNQLVKLFLRFSLPGLKAITADSDLLLSSCSRLSDIPIDRLFLIQNGINFSLLNSVLSKGFKLKYDICWCRGLSPIYQFEQFINILSNLSTITSSTISVCIIGAYGHNSNISKLLSIPNLDIHFYARLDSEDFYQKLLASKIIISIPISDSSPRSIYEAIYLKKPLFLSPLPCLDWVENFTSYPASYSTSDPLQDANLLNAMLNNQKQLDLLSLKYSHPSTFIKNLDFKVISHQYLSVFSS